VLSRVDGVIGERAAAPSGVGSSSYTNRLLADRNLRLKKLGEEASELVTACADGDRDRAAEEAADLLYHALVAVRAAGGSFRDI
jgi:phosphoribosyl-ATP pyrophosphohydrolase/phosphoribosyl-AMP cyclohydrolase